MTSEADKTTSVGQEPAWLDPEIEAALAGAQRGAAAPIDFDDLAASRARSAARAVGLTRREGVSVRDVSLQRTDDAPALRVRIYRPDDATGAVPCVYWIHGGGMVAGNLDLDDRLLTIWALKLGCAAVSVDYRLAPEHPHPTPVEDCYEGLKWTAEHTDDLGVDASALILAGGSAGGGLAAATAILARDRGGPPLALQLLIYPMLDDRNMTASSHMQLPAGVWDRKSNIAAWRALLGERFGTDDVPAHAAPARSTDLSGLPPTYIDVGTADLFRDEDVEYAVRLTQAGVPTELHLYPGAFHGWELVAPRARLTRTAQQLRIGALQRAMHGVAALDRP